MKIQFLGSFLVISVFLVFFTNISIGHSQTDISSKYGAKYNVKIGDEARYMYTKLYFADSDILNTTLRLKNGTTIFHQIQTNTKLRYVVYDINNSEIGSPSDPLTTKTFYFNIYMDNYQILDLILKEEGDTNFGFNILIKSFNKLTMVNSFVNDMNSEYETRKERSQNLTNSSSNLSIEGDYLISSQTREQSLSITKYNWKTGWVESSESIDYFENGSILLEFRVEKIKNDLFFGINLGDLTSVIFLGAGISVIGVFILVGLDYRKIVHKFSISGNIKGKISFRSHVKSKFLINRNMKNRKPKYNPEEALTMIEKIIEETKDED